MPEAWLPHFHPLACASVSTVIATVWIAGQFRQRNDSTLVILAMSAESKTSGFAGRL